MAEMRARQLLAMCLGLSFAISGPLTGECATGYYTLDPALGAIFLDPVLTVGDTSPGGDYFLITATPQQNDVESSGFYLKITGQFAILDIQGAAVIRSGSVHPVEVRLGTDPSDPSNPATNTAHFLFADPVQRGSYTDTLLLRFPSGALNGFKLVQWAWDGNSLYSAPIMPFKPRPILSGVSAAGADTSLTFVVAPDLEAQVLFSDEVQQTNWTAIHSFNGSGAGSWTHTDALLSSRGFYRLSILP